MGTINTNIEDIRNIYGDDTTARAAFNHFVLVEKKTNTKRRTAYVEANWDTFKAGFYYGLVQGTHDANETRQKRVADRIKQGEGTR